MNDMRIDGELTINHNIIPHLKLNVIQYYGTSQIITICHLNIIELIKENVYLYISIFIYMMY